MPARIGDGRFVARAGRVHLMSGGALTAWFGFQAGGFFPGSVAIAAVVLSLALLLHTTLRREPFAGWGWLPAIAAGAGAAFACWVLVSAGWSDAPSRAIVEFDRVLVYVVTFTLTAAVAHRAGDLAVVLRWALLAIVAVAVTGLATRLAPDVFPAVSAIEPARLGYPLTYWNAMSVCCALGAVLALHATTGAGERPAVRVAAAAALPVLALGVYFPLSRGGIATAAVGVVAYLVLARPRRLLTALPATALPTALALVVAYRADVLSSVGYDRGAGPAQGHHVAAVLVACTAAAALLRLAGVWLDRRIDALAPVPRGWRRGLALAGVLLVVAGAAAVDVPQRVHDQYVGFVHGNVVDPGRDTRTRLTASGNNGRLAMWRVDRSAFAAQPLHGIGAGTYQFAWQRDRPVALKVVDGHSLYLETLAELGVVGLALLVVMLVAMLAGFARGLRGPHSHAHAAALAAAVALLLHAGIDWDWEMPALFCWLFAAAGVACARPAGARTRSLAPGRLPRVLAGIACLVLALTPGAVAASQSALDHADAAFARGDCSAAVDQALNARDALSLRPEPYEIVGYCDLRAGQWGLAVRAMQSAQSRAPAAWQYAYGLAVARALAGQDPRPAIARARRLDPLEPLARDLARRFARAPRPRWGRIAGRAQIPST